jgi:hypothetical protein
MICVPSRKALVQAVERSMPDEYPAGFAEYMADDMLKSGEAVIVEESADERTLHLCQRPARR